MVAPVPRAVCRFDWPSGLTLSVAYERIRERRFPYTDEWVRGEARAAWEYEVSADDDGLQVQVVGFARSMRPPTGTPSRIQAASSPIFDLVYDAASSFLLSPAGNVLSVTDGHRIRRDILRSLGPLDAVPPAVAQAVLLQVSDEVLLGRFQDFWGALITLWSGGDFPLKQVITFERPAPVPALGGITVPMLGRVQCLGASPPELGQAELRRFEFFSQPSPSSGAALMEVLTRRSGHFVGCEKYDQTVSGLLDTEPSTLIPAKLEMTRKLEVLYAAPGREFMEETETRRWRFRRVERLDDA